MSGLLIFAVVAFYFAALFGVALLIDRRGGNAFLDRFGGMVYALSLAVYCTSWTFFGSVGRASTSGISFLAVYVGPILVFVLGMPLLRRLVILAKAQHTTSIADFISTRHGKSQGVASLVTMVSVVGILPYISLQLKAVAGSLDTLLRYPLVGSGGATVTPSLWGDPAFHAAVVLAGFCIVFGTRQIVASEQHRGLVTLIAMESLVKLVAFVAIGVFVVWGMFGGLAPLVAEARKLEDVARLLDVTPHLLSADWWAIVLASALAILCLPRQFQVLVVENVRRRHLSTARWTFPLYLVAINLFVLPIAVAGVLTFRGHSVAADTYLLALPISAHQPALALFAFVGGLSAATAMVLVEVTALSTMISNDLIMPVLLRRLMASGRDPVGVVKAIRRMSVVLVLLMAYGYVRVIGDSFTLVRIGLVSFVAAAQFAPALLAGLYFHRPSAWGAIGGLGAGFAVWAHTLFMPTFGGADWFLHHSIEALLASLLPTAATGVAGMNEITRGLLWSLTANLCAYALGTWLENRHRDTAAPSRGAPLRDKPGAEFLQSLVARFIGEEQARIAFAGHPRTAPHASQSPDDAGSDLTDFAERLLAGAIGGASARVVIAAASDGEGLDADYIRGMLKDASAAIESSRAVMADALDHLGQGVMVADGDLHLVAWNRRFLDLQFLPPDFVRHGMALEEIMRHNAGRGEYGDGEVEPLVARRLEWLRAGEPFHEERERPDGSAVEVVGQPLPNGGIVIVYTDVTRRYRAEHELRRSHDELERRVEDRTKELSQENRIRAMTEQALRHSRERMKGITDSLFEGVLMVTGKGMIAFANPAARALLEIGPELGDIEGYPLDDIVRIRTVESDQDFVRSPFHEVLQTGKAIRDDDALFIPASGKVLSVAYACSALAEDENRKAVIISFRDISQLKAAQREVVQASRLATVGQLAAGIAHEINTPVQYIGDNLRYIESSVPKLLSVVTLASQMAEAARHLPDVAIWAERFEATAKAAKLPFLANEIPTALRESLDGVAQISRIVLSMKEFSHPGTSNKTTTDINRALDSTLTVSRNVWKHVAEVTTAFDPALPPVLCYAGELNQVFLNLVVNAAQALESSGKPLPGRIAISTIQVDGMVEITIADNGPGVPEGLRDRIFDPFFTTKDVGKGTGQGLAICRDVIVTKHGGSLDVKESSEGGAAFIVRLPLNDAPGGNE